MFWGIGRDGQGSNEFGKALMRLRGRLRVCARCSPRLHPPSVPISPPEPASDANVGMYSTVCCTGGVLMSPTISSPAIAILTLASARSVTCRWMQTNYSSIRTSCVYNHDQLVMYALHSSLRIYLSLYSECKVGSLAALVADHSGTPAHDLSRSAHLSLAPFHLQLDTSTLPRFIRSA